MLDTAGRTTLDDAMMSEAAEVKRAVNPHEVLLVADALTGQDAVNLARSFDERVGLTGIVLTRVDGDGRGGAALSMRAVTGKPIKLIGTGEKLDALEDFDPARIAGRILGMGDIVALVEKAAANIDAEKAMRAAEKMRKGAFDLADLREQLTQMQAMGGLGGLMGMLPGVAKMKNQLAAANLDENVIKRQIAIIDSMTPKERRNPDLLKASRKKRIASGSGTTPEAINKLLKMHRGMADMMKMMGGGQARPARRPRAGHGFRRRHAVTGTDGRNGERKCRADSCRRICRRPAADHAEAAAEYARPAWLAGAGRKVSRIAGRSAARTWKEKVILRSISNEKGTKECLSLSVLPAPAPRNGRSITSSSPTIARPRDGRFIERLGYFNPLLPKEKTERLKLDLEKVQAWMKKGAQPSDRVMRFLDAAGIMKRPKRNNPEKAIPRKERKAKEEEAAKAAGAAPAAAGGAKPAAKPPRRKPAAAAEAKTEKPAEAPAAS